MILTDNHIKWISDFTEEQFDNIVYKYLEEVYKINDYVNTDGSYDGGNDLRIFHDNEKLKVAFQVTIQETEIEKKLRTDLMKTNQNVVKYGYQKILYFFYSHPISEEKMNEFELMAEVEYGIKLKLIDAKRIAFAAKRFPNLIKEINTQYGLEYNNKSLLSESDRMLYDFYSFGSSAAEIKGQIIKSFIVHALYVRGDISSDELLKNLSEHFKKNDNPFFERILMQLVQEDRVFKQEGRLRLTDKESDRVDVMKEQFFFQEHELRIAIQDIIDKFNIQGECIDSILKNLRQLFESSFNADKLDVLDKISNVDHDPMSESLTSFYKFILSITTENKARYLTRELIEICKENDILQKLSAGKMFTSFVNPEVIRNYLNQTERLVFLDTPVVLYSLCLYSNDINYFNYYYSSVKDLFSLRKENKNLKFLFNKKYLSEVYYHFKDALLITDFDKAELMDALGGTNNVFYNFYLHLRNEKLLEDYVNTFEDFLFERFEFAASDVYASYFIEKVSAQVKQCLESLNVEVAERFVPKDIYNLCVQTFEECLDEKEKTRSRDTISNDSNMLATLFDDELSVNEPLFVTWDLVFLNARKKYHSKIPASRLWHWFTPDRLINHLSLLNFQLNSETVTRDVLTVIDDKFNLYKKTQTLLDIVSKLINLKTEAGRKYINAIKDFKRDYIYEIHTKPQFEYKKSDEKKVYPIEEMMFSLAKHYYNKSGGYSLEDFKQIFETDELYSEVVEYFKFELSHFVENRKASESAIPKMDEIIKKSKESSQ